VADKSGKPETALGEIDPLLPGPGAQHYLSVEEMVVPGPPEFSRVWRERTERRLDADARVSR
jgi:hypothetical protein